ncbi:MAG: type II toxin-antitoxin system CcdA family antitoxin [Holosporales bacterium]|jgi:antitoxin CcdA|nr:type II toxin-antitoxin system CcdA family antitoxin [Thalassospira sp.]
MRKSLNISVDSVILEKARAFNIPLSKVCNDALHAQVRQSEQEAWRIENRELIEQHNAFFAEYGTFGGTLPVSQGGYGHDDAQN